MDQYLVWYPLASMMAAILRGMDSYRKLRYSGGGLSLDLERNSFQTFAISDLNKLTS